MRRILALALIAVVAVLVSPVIVQGVRFQSHRSEMTKLIESAAERNLPQSVHDLLLFSLGGRTVPYAALLLIGKFDPGATDGAALADWNVTYASWCLFVALHFSEQDRLTIIARLAPTGGGRNGLDNTSQALFGRPLSDLSLSEAGTVVVLTKTPFLYDKPDRLIAARDQFLSRYQ